MKLIRLLLAALCVLVSSSSAVAGGFGSDAYVVNVSGFLLSQAPGNPAKKTLITKTELLKLKSITSDFNKYAIALITSPDGIDLVIVEKSTKLVIDIIATFEADTVIDEGARLRIHGDCYGDVAIPLHTEMQGTSLLKLSDLPGGVLKGTGSFAISTGVITPVSGLPQGTVLNVSFTTTDAKIAGVDVP